MDKFWGIDGIRRQNGSVVSPSERRSKPKVTQSVSEAAANIEKIEANYRLSHLKDGRENQTSSFPESDVAAKFDEEPKYAEKGVDAEKQYRAAFRTQEFALDAAKLNVHEIPNRSLMKCSADARRCVAACCIGLSESGEVLPRRRQGCLTILDRPANILHGGLRAFGCSGAIADWPAKARIVFDVAPQ